MGLLNRLLGRPNRGRVPAEPILYSFKALTDFYAVEVKSQYSRGEVYRVRNNNDKLHKLVQSWITEGKVEII